jgi:hypothetical protein
VPVKAIWKSERVQERLVASGVVAVWAWFFARHLWQTFGPSAPVAPEDPQPPHRGTVLAFRR